MLNKFYAQLFITLGPGLEVIKLEYSLSLKIKPNDWHVSASSQSLRSLLSLRMNSSFISLRPGFNQSIAEVAFISSYCAESGMPSFSSLIEILTKCHCPFLGTLDMKGQNRSVFFYFFCCHLYSFAINEYPSILFLDILSCFEC